MWSEGKWLASAEGMQKNLHKFASYIYISYIYIYIKHALIYLEVAAVS